MPKNIILLSDGTGNSNIKDRGTNVFKLYEALDCNLSDYKQVAFYDDGVGTQEFKPLKILGGAFGWGLSRNVMGLYEELVQCYDPGDKIYFFGFSRGAFTVRTLAGFIAKIGILNSSHYTNEESLHKAVLLAYQKYRSTELSAMEVLLQKIIPTSRLDQKIGKLHFHNELPNLEFIGVWDTVDAVGLPFDELTDFWNKVIFRFKFTDQHLHKLVKKACHALSIDDKRRSFKPLLWHIKNGDADRIEQVWFPGVHSNVGGGYPQQGLSLVALNWMITKAEKAGLKFIHNDVQFVKDKEYAFDKMYNPRSGLGIYYRYKLRDIAKFCQDNNINTPKIHISAFKRITQGVSGYAPGNLPEKFEVVDNISIHPKSSLIYHTIKTAVAELPEGSLLNKVKTYIHARNILYQVFLIFTFIILYVLFADDYSKVGIFGILKILVSPDGLLDKIGILFWDKPIFVGVGLVIFGSTVYVRKQIGRVFGGFWSKVRPDLQKLL
jgi:Uncharacterized alpha/beta hydrolase domain (DUF2235)